MSDDAPPPVVLPPDFDPAAALLEIDALVRRKPAPGGGDWNRWQHLSALYGEHYRRRIASEEARLAKR